jgi:hypothetical protein
MKLRQENLCFPPFLRRLFSSNERSTRQKLKIEWNFATLSLTLMKIFREIFPWRQSLIISMTLSVSKLASHAACRNVNKSKLSNYSLLFLCPFPFFLRTSRGNKLKIYSIMMINTVWCWCCLDHFIRMFRFLENLEVTCRKMSERKGGKGRDQNVLGWDY